VTPCPISRSIIRNTLRHYRRLCRVLRAASGRRTGRGYDRQEEQRIMERDLKKAALVFIRWSGWQGQGREACAARLGVSYDTLSRWHRQWSQDSLKPNGRGRPARLSTPQEQAVVRETLEACGPATGIPTLTAMYPEMARREMARLISDFRTEYWQKHNLVYCLQWLVPGVVWAIDYTDTDPSKSIDGIYPHLLVVRDLGSGDKLLSLPVTEATAETTCDALCALFKTHRPPVVLKADQNGHFTGNIVQDLLWQNSVTFLLNPPYYPQYNGACEAGIGSLKVRAHHIAARNNRPGEWTSDDVEAARLLANRTARPMGPKGPTAEELWKNRKPVTQDLRVAFIMSVHKYRLEVQKEEGVLELWKSDKRTQERVERKAIERALVAHAFLLVRRRRIPTPISSLFGSKIP
jgi:transposase InsO family protein